MNTQMLSNDKVKIYFIDNRINKSGQLHLIDILFAKDKNILLHREDGPAVEYASGSKYWYQNGLAHRIDGPAYMYKHMGAFNNSYYLNGKRIHCDSDDEFIKIVKFPAFL